MCTTKYEGLKKILRDMGSVLVAFSGGTDSTFLLKVAYDQLGPRAVAATAVSESYPEAEFLESKRLARLIGARQIIFNTRELEMPEFRQNSPQRCYFCKRELFERMQQIAKQEGILHIIHAENVSDQADFRPGRSAALEMGVRSPLVEVGLTKEEIRYLSRQLGLPTWQKPPFACLASRIPFGSTITRDKLRLIEQAEQILRGVGFKQFRLRHHDQIARIEVSPEQIQLATQPDIRSFIVQELKAKGYTYVTLDLEGYRTGSLLEAEHNLRGKR
jgi:uncharacterized protein